jgi:chromate reductase, NAD(P)H dehydrogenase (quinone)
MHCSTSDHRSLFCASERALIQKEEAMNSPLQILGIAGSLRKGSFNRMTLQAAQKLTPSDAHMDIFDMHGIPAFNQDDERKPPAVVSEFKQRIRAADAILFATPEYNYSVPGVLKNAIDWASRPYGDNAWDGKPVAIISASGGIFGGARAQYALRQSFIFLNMYQVNQPEVMIGKANEKFDPNGNLNDEIAKKLITQLLQNLVDWTRRLSLRTK